jgi:uncharacterized protein YlxW (UPF0749 family)
MSTLSWRTYLVFVATGVFIGLLVTMQVKSSMPSSSYIYDQLAVQKELIKDYVDEQAMLKSKIVALRTKIEENQANIRQSSKDTNLETLKELKNDIGLSSAKGGGVEIKLNDGFFVNRENIEEIDQSLVQASDLRDIVNLMRSAKATAISINDQRVIASTPISSVGNTIMVNNYHVLPPFNVVALGDPELIMPLLSGEGSLPDLQKRISQFKIQFSAEAKTALSVPVYNGNLTSKFLQESSNGNQ